MQSPLKNGSMERLNACCACLCFFIVTSFFLSLQNYAAISLLYPNCPSVNIFPRSGLPGFSRRRLASRPLSQTGLPPVTQFQIQGIPVLMHCKFFLIMNHAGRIKGTDVEHTFPRNVRDPEVAQALMNLN